MTGPFAIKQIRNAFALNAGMQVNAIKKTCNLQVFYYLINYRGIM